MVLICSAVVVVELADAATLKLAEERRGGRGEGSGDSENCVVVANRL